MINKHSVGLFVLFLVLLAVPLTAYLAYRNQNPNSEASKTDGTGVVTLSPANLTLETGDSNKKKVDVMFDTAGKGVNGVQVILSYSFSGTDPAVTAGNVIIDPDLRTNSNAKWSCPTTKVEKGTGKVEIQLGCVFTGDGGYTTTGSEKLASFELTAASAPATNPFLIGFEADRNFMYESVAGSSAVDILKTPVGGVNVTVGTAGGVTPTTVEPTPTGNTHLTCINSACAVIAGEGADNCTKEGSSCTQTFSGDAALNCNGRYDPNCFNCVNDSEINSLDFACFRSAYLKERIDGTVKWQ